MLHLLQIMNFMLVNLEHSVSEVEGTFADLEAGEITIEDLIDSLGIEPWSEPQMKMLAEKLPKWRSALAVTKMRLNI